MKAGGKLGLKKRDGEIGRRSGKKGMNFHETCRYKRRDWEEEVRAAYKYSESERGCVAIL